MSQQKSKKTLINWDLVSVNPNDKNWDWKDLFCFWGMNIQSIIGFSLISIVEYFFSLSFLMVLHSYLSIVTCVCFIFLIVCTRYN